jgi:biopolymer transport protein ExbD
MARRRNRAKIDLTPPKGDMTPMIDVVFQLLIFFMLTIEFKQLEGKLAAYLPKDVGVNAGKAEQKEKVEIVLKVVAEGSKLDPLKDIAWSGDGPFRYGPDRRVDISIGPKTTRDLEEVKKRLKDLRAQDPERPATIDSLPGTVYEDVISVLDVVLLAGYTDVTFIGARDAPAKKK